MLWRGKLENLSTPLIFMFISPFFQVADSEPDEAHLFLQFESAKAIEGRSPDFRL